VGAEVEHAAAKATDEETQWQAAIESGSGSGGGFLEPRCAVNELPVSFVFNSLLARLKLISFRVLLCVLTARLLLSLSPSNLSTCLPFLPPLLLLQRLWCCLLLPLLL
jgi:hypothetical protein